MQRLVTRRRIIWLGIGAMVAFLLADACVATPAHDVHTPGATPLAPTLVANVAGAYGTTKASESIADLRCQVSRVYSKSDQCQDIPAADFFPLLTQAPNTLYILWGGCPSSNGSLAWQGYNLEFLPSARQLLLHCYEADPWIGFSSFRGLAFPPAMLLIVPTGRIGPGTIQIVEDDRFEHLLGEQSTVFQLASATIS